jgi:predicted transport protein
MYKTEEGEALSTTRIYDSTSARGPVTRGSYAIDWHFSGRYASMKPTFEKLASEIQKQLKVEPYYRKQFIAFKRNYIFVDVHVYTDRIEVGLPIPDEINPSARFARAPEGRFGSRITHNVKLQAPKDVDDELMATISEAYKIS